MNIISAENVGYEYIKTNLEGDIKKIRALENVSFDIKQGQFVSILGHNGSGKSTLAKNINCLLTVTEGTIIVDGLSTINEENFWDIRKNCGMVFQNPDNQIVATLVENDVGFGLENLGVPSEEIIKRVDEALKWVGMEDHKESVPSMLSGGQKQRVAIAGILAMRPKCIIFDESTAMLDPNGRREVLETALMLNKQENITVILITHYMEEVVFSDKVIVMGEGKIQFEGTPIEVFAQRERLEELKLTIPLVTKISNLVESDKLQKNILSLSEFKEKFPAKTGDKVIDFSDIVEQDRASKEDVVVDIRNLTHTYNIGTSFSKVALNDVSLKINHGDFIGIIGHTGSGKSTLIQHMNLILKPTSEDSKIFVCGDDILQNKENLKAVRKKIGLIFQYPEYQLFETTVYNDVAFGCKNLGFSEEETDIAVREALGFVGIEERFFDKSPFELSGGQRRKVAIAGVIAMRPEILILDEPVAGLDPVSRQELLDNIENMRNKLCITIILVSHSMDDIATMTNKVIVMDNSELVYYDQTKNVFKNVEHLEKIGLEVPTPTKMLQIIREKGYDVPLTILSIENVVRIIERILSEN